MLFHAVEDLELLSGLCACERTIGVVEEAAPAGPTLNFRCICSSICKTTTAAALVDSDRTARYSSKETLFPRLVSERKQLHSHFVAHFHGFVEKTTAQL